MFLHVFCGFYMYVYIYIYLYYLYKYIYIYILAWDLCIYMHRESGSDVQVDPIVKLIWSKCFVVVRYFTWVDLACWKKRANSSTYRHTHMQLSWLQLIAHHTISSGILVVGFGISILIVDCVTIAMLVLASTAGRIKKADLGRRLSVLEKMYTRSIYALYT